MNEPTPEKGGELTPENLKKNPYDGIFFEVDALLEKAKESCAKRILPLVVRSPKENQVFGVIEVYQNQDFGLNYNSFLKVGGEITTDFEQFGDESAIPGLAEHIEGHLEGKSTSQEQNQEFCDKLDKRLIEFFSDAWNKAGGQSAKIPTFLALEERDEYIDFQTGDVLSEEDVLSRIERSL